MDHRFLLSLLLLLQGYYVTQAQFNGSPPPNDYYSGFNTTTAVIFGTLVILFFGIALFSLCFYQRNYINDISGNRPRTGTAPTTSNEPGQTRVQKGVDQSVLDTFPIMEYAAIKKLGTVKGPLECAVCLAEFADDESLKLLPGCCHVFHPECIDQWLEDHITCPVCRADVSNLSVAIEDADAISEAGATGSVTTEGDVSNHEDASGVPSGAIHTVDRFTLRLPSHVIREIEVARRHRRSLSIAGYAYVRRGSTNERSGRLRSFLRTFSGALRRESEAGSRSSKRVFTVNEVAETSATSRNIGSSSLSGDNQDQRSPSNVSHMALLDRV